MDETSLLKIKHFLYMWRKQRTTLVICFTALTVFAALESQAIAQTDEDDIESEIDDELELPASRSAKPSPAEEAPPSATQSGEAEPDDSNLEVVSPTNPTPPDATSAESAPLDPSQSSWDAPRGTSKSAPLFDWSKHKGERIVPHPLSEKGLIRVNKDGSFMYKVAPSEQNRAVSLRFASFVPENLENPDRAGQPGATFFDNYDQTDSPAILVDFEWQIWKMALGKLGLRLGTGFYTAQGNGTFVNGNPLTPKENFTFLAMPNSLGAVYRMQYWDNQLLVPYVDGGGVLFTFAEIRDDDKGPKFGASAAAYAAGGLAFNLSYFNYLSRVNLDREYGINSVYLTAEFRRIFNLSPNFDFSGNMINGGFTVEY